MSAYKIGYARVSTLQQDEALQLDALRAAGVDRLFVDKASGKVERRPALDDLLAQARPGDSLLVWRLDRLGRSLRHLIDVVSELEQRGVGFISLTEAVAPPTQTPCPRTDADGLDPMNRCRQRSVRPHPETCGRWSAGAPPPPCDGGRDLSLGLHAGWLGGHSEVFSQESGVMSPGLTGG